jgi:hypothetical protein
MLTHRSRDHGDRVFFIFGIFFPTVFLPKTKRNHEEAGAEIFAFRWLLYRYAETTAKRTKTENDLQESPVGPHSRLQVGGSEQDEAVVRISGPKLQSRPKFSNLERDCKLGKSYSA